MLPRLQRCWSPLLASLALDAISVVSHAHCFLLQGRHPCGLTPWLFVARLLTLSVLLIRIFNAAAGSVLLPHLLHQSLNAWIAALTAACDIGARKLPAKRRPH